MNSCTCISPTAHLLSCFRGAGGYSTYHLINRGLVHVSVDHLTTTFAALADPTRRAILNRLAEGEATVNELAEPFPISTQAVSQHLKVLERAGLITRGRR